MSDTSNATEPRGFLRRLRSGMNILDLTLVMVVVTLLTGIAIPAFYSQPRVTLDHASILLANDLRYAQNEAAIAGEGTVLSFAADGDGYSVRYKSGRRVANPVGGDDLTRHYSSDAIFSGVSLELLEGGPDLCFDRNGFALDRLRVRLSYQSETRVLTMVKGSGLVRIDGLQSEWLDQGL